ncbi:MAG: tetratricopeptide repeat protein [bacterium]|nr:tetratricopeptide repeat protein [bacterium]
MNRAHKHELERNILADRMESMVASVQPILPAILGGIAILVVGSIIWGVYSSSVKSRQSAAWTEYYFNLSGGDAEAYLDVAEAYPTSNMSGWARLAAADSYLHKGIEALYVNRSEGEDNLNQAVATYQEILQAASEPGLIAKAQWGLAQAHESLGDLEQAASFYEQFASTATQPELINAAASRLAFINSATGKSFYDWFSKLEPKPDAPIQLPSDLSFPPVNPDLQFGTPDSGLDFGSPSSEGSSDDSPLPLDPPAEIDPENLPELDLTAPAGTGKTDDIQSLDLPPAEGDNTGKSTEGDS